MTETDIAAVLGELAAQLPVADLTLGNAASVRIPMPDRRLRAQARPVTPDASTPSTLSAWIRQVERLLRSNGPGARAGLMPQIVSVTGRPEATQPEQGAPDMTAAARLARTSDSYGIVIPPGWLQQSLDPTGFERSIADQKAQMLAQGIDRVDIRRFELLQRQINSQLRTEDVRCVATLAAQPPVDEVRETEPGSMLLAGMVLTSRSREELGAPGPITTGLLVRSFGSSSGEPGDPIDIEPPKEVDLLGGKALRLVRFHSQTWGDSGRADSVDFYEHAYLLPHDDGRRVAFLQLVTPSLAYTEPLGNLFDAIADTVRVFYPDDSTTFDLPVPEAAEGSV
jgi:hypothetical protein